MKRSTWIAVAVVLLAFFVSQFRLPDIDKVLSGALNPVEELEVWRR